jgi:hypothetical protein
MKGQIADRMYLLAYQYANYFECRSPPFANGQALDHPSAS